MDLTISPAKEKTYIEKLKEIKGEVYEKLVPSAFYKKFESLGDLYEANVDVLASTTGSGIGSGSVGPIKQFQQTLNNNKAYWLRIHSAIQPIIVEIPDDSYVNKVKFLLSSLSEYYKEKEWLEGELGASEKKISSSEVLNYYYGINDNNYFLKNELIASKFDCAPQNVDTVRFDLNLENIFLNTNQQVKLKFHGTNFTEDLSYIRFKSKAIKTMDPDGKTDPDLIDRYTAVLGYNIVFCKIIKRIDAEVSRYFLTEKSAIGEFKENLRILVKTSNKEINSRTEEEIINDVKVNWEKEKFNLNSEIISALINGVELFKENFNEEEQKFYINWVFLSGVKEKVARILMESDSQMFRYEIFKEYNIKSLANYSEGLDSSKQIRVTHKNVLSRGNNVFVFGDKNSLLDNGQRAIEKIAKKLGGPFTFNKLHDILLSEYPQYKNRGTVKSYITWKSGCRRVIKNNNFDYIHESLLDQYPEIKVAVKQNSGIGYFIIQEVFKALKNINGLSFGELECIVKKEVETNFNGVWRRSYYNSKLEQLIADDFLFSNKEGLVASNINNLNEREVESIGKRQEPAYKRAIKDKTVQILKSRENVPVLLKDLWKEVSDLYPKEVAQTNFYKLFYDLELFVKQEVNGKQAVSLKLELMPEPVRVDKTATVEVVGVPIKEWEAIQKQLKTPFILEELLGQISNNILNGYRISNSQTEKGVQKLKSIYLDYQNSSSSRWMHGLFQDLHEVWNKKTDIYDRRSCLDKLVSSFETFVKKLIWNKDEYIGLGGLLNEDRVLKSLRWYCKNYRYQNISEVDVLKKDMSFALRKLKSMADALRHNMDEEKIQINYAEGNAIKNIQDFVTLYVYAASIS